MINLLIDPEIKETIPTLTREEYECLEKSLIREGCREALIVWDAKKVNFIILDGHHRYEICKRHNIPFQINELLFNTKQEAINWVIDNQLGRRNLTPEQKTYLIGKKYKEEKKGVGRPSEKLPQNEGISTAERIAKEHKISRATVERAVDFTDAVDTLAENVGKEVKQKILSGESNLTQKDIKEIAKKPAKDQKKAIDKIKKRPRGINNVPVIKIEEITDPLFLNAYNQFEKAIRNAILSKFMTITRSAILNRLDILINIVKGGNL